jgi:hypothetical protein
MTVTPPDPRVVIHNRTGEGYGDSDWVKGETFKQRQ